MKKQTKTMQKRSQTAVQKTTPQKGKGRSAAQSGTRTVRTVPAKQVAKVSTERGTKVAVTDKLFAGARFIEITGSSISVTHAASRSQKGSFQKVEVRKYMPQNDATLEAVSRLLNQANRTGKVKKVRIEFKK